MLRQVREKLRQAGSERFMAVVGLDGFVDEVVHVVAKRASPTEFERVRTLRAYGERIAASSGLSSNVEIVTVDKKLGGNGPILALGLKQYGAGITYIGSTGAGSHDAVFAELAEGSRIIGVCDPGRTDAMEFDDGKLIRSKLDTLNAMTWETLAAKLPAREFAVLLDGARLVSFNNWTMIAAMSGIWKRVLADVLPLMNAPKNEKILFFDLADPEKRRAEDVLEALELIREFKAAGFETVLGLNKKEAAEIAELLGRSFGDPAAADLRELTEYVAAGMNIDCVAVHPTDSAACVRAGVYARADGPYCARPRLTTGAGDNFNAGFLYGYVMGFGMEPSLLLGAATSGFYVREGRSPSREEMDSFLGRWEAGTLDGKEEKEDIGEKDKRGRDRDRLYRAGAH